MKRKTVLNDINHMTACLYILDFTASCIEDSVHQVAYRTASLKHHSLNSNQNVKKNLVWAFKAESIISDFKLENIVFEL